MDLVELRLLKESDRQKQLLVHSRIAHSHHAILFADIVKINMQVAVSDGETSSGYPKMRIMTPDEIIARSLAIAHALFSATHTYGWAVVAPPIGDLVEERQPMSGFTGERK